MEQRLKTKIIENIKWTLSIKELHYALIGLVLTIISFGGLSLDISIIFGYLFFLFIGLSWIFFVLFLYKYGFNQSNYSISELIDFFKEMIKNIKAIRSRTLRFFLWISLIMRTLFLFFMIIGLLIVLIILFYNLIEITSEFRKL